MVENNGPTVRHVLGISGGKDSAALAIYLRDRIPEMEYYFTDTGAELQETYEYLTRLEAVLGKPIVRLNADRDFDHWLWVFGGVLPSPQMRWCTKNLKIKPFEAWIGTDQALSYIAIRADENRDGYISRKPNITPMMPFKDDGIDEAGVRRILADSGVGVPDYYAWRTRSGCYFCFFQRKHEWVRLSEEHPDLFEQAVAYEDKVNYEQGASKGEKYSWSPGEDLRELIARKDQIKAEHTARLSRTQAAAPNQPLIESLASVLDEEDADEPCLACHL